MRFTGRDAPRASEAGRGGEQAGVGMLPAASGISTEGQRDPPSAGEDWQLVEGQGSPFLQEIHFSGDTQGHRAGLRGQKRLVTCTEGALDLLRDREARDHPQQAWGLGYRVRSDVFPLFDFPKDAEGT